MLSPVKKTATKSPARAERELALQAEDARLAALSDDARARALVARFGVHDGPISSTEAQRRLVAMGADAVPALAAHLDDATTGWQAAFTLAQIGTPGADASSDALLRHARSVPDTRATMWSAQALARLGRIDDVEALLALPDKAYHVANALAAVTPGTYAAIDRCLDRSDDEVRKALANALRPGRGRFFDVDPTSFELALAGARSAHAMVRVDAVLLLVDRAYPKHERARAVAELVQLTLDTHAEVRRVTALSLGRSGKRTAKLSRPALDALCNDTVERVRTTAEQALRDLG